MLSEFFVYFRLGIGHISDLKGFDHILFLVALTAGYAVKHWRPLLWLVTAFTLGHSVTLAIATLGLVQASPNVIEPLIAVTIILTGVVGLTRVREQPTGAGAQRTLYLIAGFFGLIHGLGFSTFLRSMLGAESGIAWPLFAFNVGLEAGQLVIVASILVVGTALCEGARLPRRWWSGALSVVAVVAGVKLLLDRTLLN